MANKSHMELEAERAAIIIGNLDGEKATPETQELADQLKRAFLTGFRYASSTLRGAHDAGIESAEQVPSALAWADFLERQ